MSGELIKGIATTLVGSNRNPEPLADDLRKALKVKLDGKKLEIKKLDVQKAMKLKSAA